MEFEGVEEIGVGTATELTEKLRGPLRILCETLSFPASSVAVLTHHSSLSLISLTSKA